MDELYLVFINSLNVDYKGDHLYEFIFSDTLENVDGENWDVYPASGNPTVPNEEFIHKVGKIETTIKLNVIQNSDTYSVWDSQDGVVALAWENIMDLDVYPEHRLVFPYGITIKEVEDKLYDREIQIKYYDI